MKNKRFILFTGSALVAIIFICVLVIAIIDRPAKSVMHTGNALFPNLADHLNDINSIVIGNPSTAVHLIQTDGEWTVQNHHQYPASFTSIDRMVRALVNAKKEEQKTNQPANYSQLGLGEEALSVQLFGTKLWDKLHIGAQATQRNGQFIRFEQEEHVWLIDQDLHLFDNPNDWLERQIINIPFTRIAKVVYSKKGKGKRKAQKITLTRSESIAALQPTKLPKKKKLQYERILERYGQSLQNINLADVQPADTVKFKANFNVTYQCFDPLIIHAALMEMDGERYLRLSFERAEKPVAAPSTASQHSDVIVTADTVAALNTRHSPWVYLLNDYEFNRFKVSLKDALIPAE